MSRGGRTGRIRGRRGRSVGRRRWRGRRWTGMGGCRGGGARRCSRGRLETRAVGWAQPRVAAGTQWGEIPHAIRAPPH